ncbi:MAG: SDR family oxidoreductase [Rhodospirillaceae bacterium]|nr:SDR family oxidoreductase [Rhodospirillaceae bacterium]
MGKQIDLESRVYIVGGAGGGGMGMAACALLAQAGGIVIGVDKSDTGRAAAEEALKPFGAKHRVVDADLMDADAMEALIAQVTREVGPVRGAVNVVGGMLPHHWQPLINQRTTETLDDVIRFNLRAAFVTSTAVARAVVAHGLGGSIVHLSSAAGSLSMAYGAGYAAAKAALNNLTRTMAVEWGPLQLRVNAVAPGSIRPRKSGRPRLSNEETDETRKLIRDVVPLGRRGEPEEVGSAVLFLISDLAAYITGQTLLVDGGSTVRAPYTDGDNLPVFVTDPGVRKKMRGEA